MPLPSSITTRLEYQHKSLLDIIEGLSDEQIRRQVIAGKWSIFENIVHLVTYQHTFIRRLRQIQTDHDPEFGKYTAETDPLFFDNCTRSTREIMQDLISTRREMVAAVHTLKDDEIKKTGGHPVYGRMNVSQ